jgi:hypothetical protein
MSSNRPSFASLPHDLRGDATCTTSRHSFIGFEAKLENSKPTCFTVKQAAGCRRSSSHCPHLLGFDAQTKKIVAIILKPKLSNCSTSFEAQTEKLVVPVFFMCTMWITHDITRHFDRPPAVTPSSVLRQNWETLNLLVSRWSKPPDVDVHPHTVLTSLGLMHKPKKLLR